MNQKISFLNDYAEGAHPSILKALSKTNFEQHIGYGEDDISLEAIEKLKSLMNNQDVDIHFISGGTQSNLIGLSSMLQSYESVIAAETGHIAVHEAGAIEYTGHKINTISTPDGKLSPSLIQPMIDIHEDEHMVKPKVIFISNSTELGTIYTKKELEDLSIYCKQNNLYLYLDGARLGSALASHKNDVDLSDLVKYLDMFYIGATKNGALLGEAMIIINPKLKKDFRFILKQRGALLAKGRILGAQFQTLFKDNLYFSLADHANQMSMLLADEMIKIGYNFFQKPETNQIFPILPISIVEELLKKYDFYIWKKLNNYQCIIRIVTSWATPKENILEFIGDVKKLSNQ